MDKLKMHFYWLWNICSNVLLKVVGGCLPKIKNASLMEYNRSPKQMSVGKTLHMLQLKWLGPSLLSAESLQLSGTYARSLRDPCSPSAPSHRNHRHTKQRILSRLVVAYVVSVRGAAASSCESVEVVAPSSWIDKVIMRTSETQTHNPA